MFIKILLGNLQFNFVSQYRIQDQNSLGIHYLCSFFQTLNRRITHCMDVGVLTEQSASLWKNDVEEYNGEKYCQRNKTIKFKAVLINILITMYQLATYNQWGAISGGKCLTRERNVEITQ